MSRPRFLADQDFNEHIIDGLLRREPTIHITRARDHGLSAAPDREVLEFSYRNQLILLSHDVNTMSAAAYDRIESNQQFAGLLMIRQTLPIRNIVDDLMTIWSVTEAEEWINQVWFLPI